MTQAIRFKEVREQALGYWITQTGRSIKAHNEVLVDSFDFGYECNWQSKARELKDDDRWHVSYFCSLGDWASNISDLLLDSRFDSLQLSDPNSEDAKILFRFYTRILLVVSEMLVDFIDIANTLGLKNKLFKDSSYSRFINSVCKHKAGKQSHYLHICNHHLPIHFEDSNLTSTFASPLQISIGKRNIEPDGIIIPKLNEIIDLVVSRYKTVNQQLMADEGLFDKFPDLSTRIITD